MFISVSTLKGLLANLMETELQHVLVEGWSKESAAYRS